MLKSNEPPMSAMNADKTPTQRREERRKDSFADLGVLCAFAFTVDSDKPPERHRGESR